MLNGVGARASGHGNNLILAAALQLRRKSEACRYHFTSGVFLHTMTVCPVLESIRVVTGTQRQETVLAFSCLVTTQCSMSSAVGGGIWLRTGAGGGG
jgi:hypothetical protein